MKNYLCTSFKLGTVISRIMGWPYLTVQFLGYLYGSREHEKCLFYYVLKNEVIGTVGCMVTIITMISNFQNSNSNRIEI